MQANVEDKIKHGVTTVLVTDDDSDVLKVTAAILETQGYSVIPASTPVEAMRLAREHKDDIHLLITDVIMPDMNGRMLATKVKSIYPQVKVLFMSGYPADVVARHGVLDKAFNFIQKPFTADQLANKLTDVLERE